ncbi:right-handed parallel beta-helix repeat-containing protein [Halegenticoccus soli]|uniref:right-handed parallel beta-helix repeat-containing protein n=1 Tax=Halegenticoccus soli TaxID=1985678 RepID=UPI001179FFCD|nr:right-handed parallel beta-helix repeat-containing protein [Halegenticoccus soli]
MDEQIRFTDFDHLWLQGEAGETTIVPASGDDFSGQARLFKLGTYYSPGEWLEVGGFTFDFTASNTGLRGIQAQVNGCCIHDVEFIGEHDSGTWGPMLVDIVDSAGTGLVERVRMPDGGLFTANASDDADPTVETGPTGLLLSPYHRGELTVRDTEIGAFPDNGLYVSGTNGRVIVDGGTFKNSNVANIRLAGDGSAVRNATIIIDENRNRDQNQPGIRLDAGQNMVVENTTIKLDAPNGDAISVLSEVSSAQIANSSITIASGVINDGIVLKDGSGDIEISDTDISMDSGGQAIQIRDGNGQVQVEGVTVTGDASGASGGRSAIRCDRGGSEFVGLTVDQPGGGYRRAITLTGDNCTIESGTYESTHHAIVNDASGTTISGVTARAYNGAEAVKLLAGNSDVTIVDSVLYNGIDDRGTTNLQLEGNQTP